MKYIVAAMSRGAEYRVIEMSSRYPPPCRTRGPSGERERVSGGDIQ
jgi:hypothetical protein